MSKTLSAKNWVWNASLFGASAIAFGLGLLLASYFSSQLAWLIILIGVLIHSYGMYKMYRK